MFCKKTKFCEIRIKNSQLVVPDRILPPIIILFSLSVLARVFTSIQETGDSVVISTYICSSMVNLILAGQVIYYWNVDVHAKTDSKKSV